MLHDGEHRLATHCVVPCSFVHALPHVPQLSVELCVFVSHPLFGSPSQLAYPVLHDGVHTPELHEVLPFAFEHAVVHVPQLVVVFNAVSHPFAASASQLP